MSVQSVDIYGAADFLGITVPTVRRRIKAGTFPKADSTEQKIEWWERSTLEKYQRALARKKKRSRQ